MYSQNSNEVLSRTPSPPKHDGHAEFFGGSHDDNYHSCGPTQFLEEWKVGASGTNSSRNESNNDHGDTSETYNDDRRCDGNIDDDEEDSDDDEDDNDESNNEENGDFDSNDGSTSNNDEEDYNDVDDKEEQEEKEEDDNDDEEDCDDEDGLSETDTKMPAGPRSPNPSEERGDSKIVSSNNDTWEKMYEGLLQFRATHGHCRVPHRYREYPKLGRWVGVQRRHYKLKNTGQRRRTSLTAERELLLSQIGFQWSCDVPWESYFIKLLEFVAINGHAQVPTNWDNDRKFSSWVSSQRRDYKHIQMDKPSPMTEDQIELLNFIGFVWQAERGGRKRIKGGSFVPVLDSALATVASPVFQLRAIKMIEKIRKEEYSATSTVDLSKAASTSSGTASPLQTGIMKRYKALVNEEAKGKQQTVVADQSATSGSSDMTTADNTAENLHTREVLQALIANEHTRGRNMLRQSASAGQLQQNPTSSGAADQMSGLVSTLFGSRTQSGGASTIRAAINQSMIRTDISTSSSAASTSPLLRGLMPLRPTVRHRTEAASAEGLSAMGAVNQSRIHADVSRAPASSPLLRSLIHLGPTVHQTAESVLPGGILPFSVMPPTSSQLLQAQAKAQPHLASLRQSISLFPDLSFAASFSSSQAAQQLRNVSATAAQLPSYAGLSTSTLNALSSPSLSSTLSIQDISTHPEDDERKPKKRRPSPEAK